MTYPPAVEVAMALSKLASEHQRHRGGFFAAMEIFIRPLNLPSEDVGRGYYSLRQSMFVPLVIFTQAILPTSDMRKLRRAFRVLRGQPDITKISITDSERRHELIKALREHCRKLDSSLGDITAACQMSKGCGKSIEDFAGQMMHSEGVSIQLRDKAFILKGRAEEAKRGGPFGTKKYAKDLARKSALYEYAAARVKDMSAVSDYTKSIITGYGKVLRGVEAWVEVYMKKGKDLVNTLKEKKGGKADHLRDEYNLYLEEGRVFRLAMERFYYLSYMLRQELGMVPQMVNNDELIRQIMGHFLRQVRRVQ